jgi:hypothetical protein
MKKKLTLLIVLSITLCLVAAPVMGVIAAAGSAMQEDETSSGETAELPPSTTTTTTTPTVASSTTTSTTATTTMTTTTTTVATTAATKPNTKYPEAQIVWDALIDYGLSPEVAAGIIGNIMAEVGGQTLDFSEWKYWSRGTHYGICQWGGGRKADLLNNFGPDLEDQVEFLLYELKYEIDTYGYKYKNGFGYDKFVAMTDVEQAALAFAKSYERCSSKYYNIRMTNAKKAYNYFM